MRATPTALARSRRTALASHRERGFTLVEVLVALFIMAILAAMAFRGIDAISRARAGAQGATDRTLVLNSGMSQFEFDLAQMVDTQVVQPLEFNGSTFRLTRRSPAGIQLVLWTLQDKRWQRWASAPVVHIADLQEQWLRSQQWDSISAGATSVLDDVTAFQVYCYRNGWSNCQSSNSKAPPGAPNPPGAPGNPGGPGKPGEGDSDGEGNGQTPPPKAPHPSGPATIWPTGVRLVLTLPGGDLTRERELPPLI